MSSAAASNQGYVDDGYNSVSSPHQGNGDSGMNYYRHVGRPGDSSHSNRSYLDTDSGNFYIERPTVQTMKDNSNGDVRYVQAYNVWLMDMYLDSKVNMDGNVSSSP